MKSILKQFHVHKAHIFKIIRITAKYFARMAGQCISHLALACFSNSGKHPSSSFQYSHQVLIFWQFTFHDFCGRKRWRGPIKGLLKAVYQAISVYKAVIWMNRWRFILSNYLTTEGSRYLNTLLPFNTSPQTDGFVAMTRIKFLYSFSGNFCRNNWQRGGLTYCVKWVIPWDSLL